jgi:4a-hydroxytetrahydrobiopterin dehydratase
MMTSLNEMHASTPRGDEPPLSDNEINAYRREIPDWEMLVEDGELRIRRAYKFKDFAAALVFTNQVGKLAEAEKHHPAVLTEWGKVTVTWWTHKVRGLHRNDFILAAKTDQAYAANQAIR